MDANTEERLLEQARREVEVLGRIGLTCWAEMIGAGLDAQQIEYELRETAGKEQR